MMYEMGWLKIKPLINLLSFVLNVGLYRLRVRFHLSQNFQQSYCNARCRHWDWPLHGHHNNPNNGYCDVYRRLADDAQAQTVCYVACGGPTSLYRPPLSNPHQTVLPTLFSWEIILFQRGTVKPTMRAPSGRWSKTMKRSQVFARKTRNFTSSSPTD